MPDSLNCIGCGARGAARPCCEDHPVMCDGCYSLHHVRVHPIPDRETRRQVMRDLIRSRDPATFGKDADDGGNEET